MKIKINFLALFFLLTLTLQAQNQIVQEGKVGLSSGQSNSSPCINGIIFYENNDSTPIWGSKVYLWNDQGNKLDSTVSDNSGYSFCNLQNGCYRITIAPFLKWGGVNSIDWFLILKHFVGISIIDGLHRKAGDLDINSYINSTDALILTKRIDNLSGSFPSGDWVYESPEVYITNNNNIVNINVLCAGDVNGSCNPFICNGPLFDRRDGQYYSTVAIGNQCWMKQNLNTGTRITGNISQTNNGIIEKHCYNNNPDNCKVYGGLYSWDETMQYSTTPATQGICPAGWHVPSALDWCTLFHFLDTAINFPLPATTGIITNAGAHLKETGMEHWSVSNLNCADNATGFSAIGGGAGRNGSFAYLKNCAYFWSSDLLTPSANFFILGDGTTFISFFSQLSGNNYSIRCLKD